MDARPPKVFGVQVANGYSSEARVFAQLLGERQDRYDAQVLMHSGPEHPHAVDSFRSGATCEVIPFDTGWRPNVGGRRLAPRRFIPVANFLRRRPGMMRFARRYAPDIIYSGQQHYDFRAASYIATAMDLPHVVHVHYSVGPWLQRPVLRGFHKVDHIVAVSDFIRDQLLEFGVDEHRVTTLRNSITPMPIISDQVLSEVREELGLSDQDFVVGMACRLDPGKGCEESILAFDAFARDVPNSHLVIAGGGTLEKKLHELARGCPSSSRIHLLGRRSDVPVLMAVFDAFLHPSYNDPCPLAVLEAMASGLPVLAYRQGGVLELIEHDRTGLLVPTGDIAGLTRQMQTLLDRKRARELGEAALRAIRSDFRPDDAGARFAELVSSVVLRQRGSNS